MKLIKRETIADFELITFNVENDDKVDRIMLKYKPEWNKLMDITVFYRSKRCATYSGNLSNHKMPIKYRNYVKQAMKEI